MRRDLAGSKFHFQNLSFIKLKCLPNRLCDKNIAYYVSRRCQLYEPNELKDNAAVRKHLCSFSNVFSVLCHLHFYRNCIFKFHSLSFQWQVEESGNSPEETDARDCGFKYGSFLQRWIRCWFQVLKVLRLKLRPALMVEVKPFPAHH